MSTFKLLPMFNAKIQSEKQRYQCNTSVIYPHRQEFTIILQNFRKKNQNYFADFFKIPQNT